MRTPSIVASSIVIAFGVTALLLVPTAQGEEGSATGDGSICFSIKGTAGVQEGGTINLSANKPSKDDPETPEDEGDLNIDEPIPLTASLEAVVGLIKDSLQDAGWEEGTDFAIAGNCIKFKDVKRIDGDPGDTKVVMNWATSGEAPEVTGRKVKVDNRGSSSSPGRTGRLLTLGAGRITNSSGEVEVVSVHSVVAFDADQSVEDIMAAYAQQLAREGWQTARLPGTNEVTVSMLPGDILIDNFVITVEYTDDGAPEDVRYHWAVEFTD